MDTVYIFLQHYWWFIISLLGALLVFLLFVQGGQGMLYLIGRTDTERNLIVNTLGRKWELTFTTLVTFGGAFFASFPLFYSTSFGGAFYVWMLILLVFVIQAVAYEFRRKPSNFLGEKTYNWFLLINGVLGAFLLGTAVATLFTGAPFTVDRANFGNLEGFNTISRWSTSWYGLDALADPDKIVIAQTAPAVRTALGRDFGYEPGTLVTGKMVSALRRLGFDYVFDTDFAADLTIMEEGTELLQRIGKYLKGDQEVKMPLMTSCCPGWVSFVEQHFPELLDNLSTAKSPQQMFGAIAKSYFAEKLGVDRKRIVVVSIMPCLAKKYEASRPEFAVDGNPDVDISIYTRELARLIRYANINFAELPDSDFDRPLGESTGAGVIFGTTGGVIEAACRTAYELYTKKTLPKIDFEELRGLEGIRSATIDFDGTPIKIGIAHGLGNARKLIEQVQNGMSPYHAIEVMACPGGCIGGGGQPFHRGRMEVLRKRAAALYQEDRSKTLRKSHENPYIQALYADYLGEPCGPRAHKLLHTHYFDRKEAINMFTQENQEG